ncbi:hypothetical protein CONLIGDRAFT_108194 [Coniochaeta ligniaria NRRL 30616]|uniref:Uncharacterized protein n=1 Tax=Coniochaeta ligniaria NRRL 30616 TaxID=1408157 RepID=A0A1J7I9V7_9PEZI|nr:hypothetical protein CONLIGDRAFT_108194 [Coniochaeta ligniaria NRRL 30616]
MSSSSEPVPGTEESLCRWYIIGWTRILCCASSRCVVRVVLRGAGLGHGISSSARSTRWWSAALPGTTGFTLHYHRECLLCPSFCSCILQGVCRATTCRGVTYAFPAPSLHPMRQSLSRTLVSIRPRRKGGKPRSAMVESSCTPSLASCRSRGGIA